MVHHSSSMTRAACYSAALTAMAALYGTTAGAGTGVAGAFSTGSHPVSRPAVRQSPASAASAERNENAGVWWCFRRSPRSAALHVSATADVIAAPIDEDRAVVVGGKKAGRAPQKQRMQLPPTNLEGANGQVKTVSPIGINTKKKKALLSSSGAAAYSMTTTRRKKTPRDVGVAVGQPAAVAKKKRNGKSAAGSVAPTTFTEEETELFCRIRALRTVLTARHDYEALHSNDGTTPSEAEWAALLNPPVTVSDLRQILQKGHEARTTLLSANEGLVVHIAKRYQHPNLLGSALTLQDMVQEGKMGLLEAAERFDTTRRVKFSTYATYWIRQRILRCIANHSRTIRLPAHVHALLHNILKAKRQMTEEIGRPPSLPELAHQVDMPVHKLSDIMDAARHVVSLELPLNHRRGGNSKRDSRILSDTLKCNDTPSPEDEVEVDFLRRDIRAVMQEQLLDNERRVLTLRFGLDDGTPKTMEEVARRVGVSRDRVRLIEARALNKLRHPGRNYKLKEYVGGGGGGGGGTRTQQEEDTSSSSSWEDYRQWNF